MVMESGFKSSSAQFKEFLVSSVWSDMKDYLEARKEGLTHEITQVKDPMEVKQLVGQIKEVYVTLGFPQNALEELIELEREEKEKEYGNASRQK
jgi:hypothetical protein